LPHWDADLPFTEDLGRTTRAALAIALDQAENIYKDFNMLILAYDSVDRYDSRD